ncbi:hypothetical protein Salat_0035000 [Sesamum alatum]|uniref:Uncharacterized protein n=1 Tax=Sesamum alatum TaxID=300844 RepID=A0AAE1YWF0_9LAMI|nr:hypothetical protein Salat_0035000 [Sesamum alatum]
MGLQCLKEVAFTKRRMSDVLCGAEIAILVKSPAEIRGRNSGPTSHLRVWNCTNWRSTWKHWKGSRIMEEIKKRRLSTTTTTTTTTSSNQLPFIPKIMMIRVLVLITFLQDWQLISSRIKILTEAEVDADEGLKVETGDDG